MLKNKKNEPPKESLEIDAALQPDSGTVPPAPRLNIIRDHFGSVVLSGVEVDPIYNGNQSKAVLRAEDLPEEDADTDLTGLAVGGRPVGLSLDND